MYKYFSKPGNIINKLIYITLILLLLSTCGRRTPPVPKGKSSSFGKLKAIQRGNQIRLSWTMKKPIPRVEEIQRFILKDYITPLACLQCVPEQIWEKEIPFPSKKFIIVGKNVFYYPSIDKDLYEHHFYVELIDLGKSILSSRQKVTFRGFVSFPDVLSIEWQWLKTERIDVMEKFSSNPLEKSILIKPLKFSWKQIPEKLEFTEQKDGVLIKNTAFYGVNIYQNDSLQSWPELPINSKPIFNSFYIDYRTAKEHILYYQFRLVDSEGNESKSSSTYKIVFPQIK